MAGKALATFFLLVTLLQVRADVDCYTATAECSVGASKYVAKTARECCVQGLPTTRAYSPVNDTSGCTECIVIGFSQESLALDEETEQIRIVRVKPLTSASDPVGNSLVTFNVLVRPSGPNATLGSDLKVNDGARDTIPYVERRLSQLDEELKLQTLNDTNTGEIEYFVLEAAQFHIVPQESTQALEVFPGPPLNVTITDDDIIHVEFEVTEFQLNENDKNLEITFKVNKMIPGPTHFLVRPMRYEEYDNIYDSLLEKYPDLKPYSLNDEYDQAELEDFNSTAIPFTIPENETSPDRKVIINVVDDDLLEPAEEGFRLVLVVDEEKGTRLSEVTFGRQIALCRIDNTDKIKFGFQNDVLTITDTEMVFDLQLPLRIVSGRTEFPLLLFFASGDRTNATVGVDFEDFSTEAPSIVIKYPDVFDPEGHASVQVNGDNIFEGDELIQVVLEYDWDLPDAYIPSQVNESSDYKSVVDPPPTGSVELDLKNTLIIIEEGISNNTAYLSVQNVVQEGDEFYPNITVMHIVNATFRVYASSYQRTASRNIDYSFESESVIFGPTSTWEVTEFPVDIKTDDVVEPDETFTLEFYASSPSGIDDWMELINPKEEITIIDQNSATIGFETIAEDVYENMGPATLYVAVTEGDQLATNAEVMFRFYTSSGTAQSGVDFVAVDQILTFTGAQPRMAVQIPIIDDVPYEQPETFQAHLQFVSSNANVSVDGTPATVTIYDEEPPTQYCTLSSSLSLETFHNQTDSGRDIDISMGCERKLVTSCDSDIELEIRVDFFQDNFDSTEVVIFYEDQEVFIDESFSLNPSTPPSGFMYDTGMMSAVSVSIPDIKLTIRRNRTQVTISTDDTTIALGGLCGDLQGQLVYPDCEDKFGMGDSMDDFIHSYKVKPSDQVLRDERKECGITTNDTIISDPLMTVPIHAAGFPSDLNLCYEIHGAKDKYFNLVSDGCTSVNAHYASAASSSDLNIIDSISVVAVDNTGKCHYITVDASSEFCMPEVSPTEMPTSNGKRRRRTPVPILDESGVSVRHYDSRVRISVPNCKDNELVMWVVCQNQSLFDQVLNKTIGPVEMIKFEIARGLNLKETSHGLLGQFWNIPIDVTRYNGPFVYPVGADDEYYTVDVHYPEKPIRSFVGYMFDVTWEWKHKHCLYAGDRQGGPAGEVADDGSVIEGNYEDYAVSDKFGTQYTYGVFEGVCV